jgi:hypothetical protein
MTVRGPSGWENARAATKRPPSERYEALLYSDADVDGSMMEGLGPYKLLNANSWPGHGLGPVMVARCELHTVASRDMSETDAVAFHGGDDTDELAALLSLSLGIRCKSGGTNRLWPIGEVDGLGIPVEAWHHVPYLSPPKRRGPVLPRAHRRVNLDDALPLLKRYFGLREQSAIAVVRAARLYQQAIWIADDDPSQAWVQLVSALEVAAESGRRARRTPAVRLKDAWPEIAVLLESQGGDHLDAVAELLAPTVKSTDRFLWFAAKFDPGPPLVRPHEWAQVDWTQLPQHLRMIYGYRSQALHAGTPFPPPMCEPPETLPESHYAEKPTGFATRAGDAAWVAADTPMVLSFFEDLARRMLHCWWNELT